MTDWMARANCAGKDPAIFFPSDEVKWSFQAVQICDECPVQSECLEYALANDEPAGVWGGYYTAQRERIRERRERGVPDRPVVFGVAR